MLFDSQLVVQGLDEFIFAVQHLRQCGDREQTAQSLDDSTEVLGTVEVDPFLERRVQVGGRHLATIVFLSDSSFTQFEVADLHLGQLLVEGLVLEQLLVAHLGGQLSVRFDCTVSWSISS